MIDLLPELAADLDRLVPIEEVTADWADVVRRPRPRRRRLRTALLAAALLMALAGVATATYLTLRSTSGSSADNGPLTIITDSRRYASIATVGLNGRLDVVWHCPGYRFCGDLTSIDWSPDGRHLAFTLDEIGGRSGYVGLHVLDTATDKELHIPSLPGRDLVPAQPTSVLGALGRRSLRQLGCWVAGAVAWSPDGTRLAYTCGGPPFVNESRIFVVRADGTGHREIPTGGDAYSPTWSPDGKRIAFATSGDSKKSEVVVVELDGKGRSVVATNAAAPAWSPDGRTIAYAARCGIGLVTPQGRDVTPPPMRTRCRRIGGFAAPEWSPDGTQIAIASVHGVFVTSGDGSRVIRVRQQPGGLFGPSRPAWAPAGTLQTLSAKRRA